MSNYKNQRVLAATSATMYAAFTTPQGLRGGWTHSYIAHVAEVCTH